MAFLKQLFAVFLGILLAVVVCTLGLAHFWRQGSFYSLYQFATSIGFLVTAFYFFFKSAGDIPTRIGWGLVFLILSPLSYTICDMIFWKSAFSVPGIPSINLNPDWMTMIPWGFLGGIISLLIGRKHLPALLGSSYDPVEFVQFMGAVLVSAMIFIGLLNKPEMLPEVPPRFSPEWAWRPIFVSSEPEFPAAIRKYGLQKVSARSIVSFARDRYKIARDRGLPYLVNAESVEEGGWDNSGLAVDCLREAGGRVPRWTTSELYDKSPAYSSLDDAQPGDFLYFNFQAGGDAADHVAIFIGRNEIVHAVSERGGVFLEPMPDGYREHFVGGNRYWGRP